MFTMRIIELKVYNTAANMAAQKPCEYVWLGECGGMNLFIAMRVLASYQSH